MKTTVQTPRYHCSQILLVSFFLCAQMVSALCQEPPKPPEIAAEVPRTAPPRVPYEVVMCNVGESSPGGALEQPTKYAFYRSTENEMTVWTSSWPDGIALAVPTVVYRTARISAEEKRSFDQALESLVQKKTVLIDLTLGGRGVAVTDLKAIKLICRWPESLPTTSNGSATGPFQPTEFTRYHDFAVILVYDNERMLKKEYPAYTFPWQLFADYSEQGYTSMEKFTEAERERLFMPKCAVLRDSRFFLELYHTLSKTRVPSETVRSLSPEVLNCKDSPYCGAAEKWLETPVLSQAQVMLVNSWLMDKWPEVITTKPINRKRLEENILKDCMERAKP